MTDTAKNDPQLDLGAITSWCESFDNAYRNEDAAWPAQLVVVIPELARSPLGLLRALVAEVEAERATTARLRAVLEEIARWCTNDAHGQMLKGLTAAALGEVVSAAQQRAYDEAVKRYRREV